MAVVDFERSSLRSASADLRSAQDSFAVGQQLATALDDPDLRGVLVLSDGITCNGSALVSGLLSVLPSDASIFGGLAADGDAFESTVVLDSVGVGPGRVVAVGFMGKHLVFGAATGGGWATSTWSERC